MGRVWQKLSASVRDKRGSQQAGFPGISPCTAHSNRPWALLHTAGKPCGPLHTPTQAPLPTLSSRGGSLSRRRRSSLSLPLLSPGTGPLM
jgi:hypothetical protein